MTNTLKKPNALVAEDDRALADIVRLALARAGYAVHVAHDGRNASQLLDSIAFAVVVSDYQMPGMNGDMLLRKVRDSSLSGHAKLVLCSAKSYELDSEYLRTELGLAGVFYKPFSLSELVATIQKPDSNNLLDLGSIGGKQNESVIASAKH